MDLPVPADIGRAVFVRLYPDRFMAVSDIFHTYICAELSGRSGVIGIVFVISEVIPIRHIFEMKHLRPRQCTVREPQDQQRRKKKR